MCTVYIGRAFISGALSVQKRSTGISKKKKLTTESDQDNSQTKSLITMIFFPAIKGLIFMCNSAIYHNK